MTASPLHAADLPCRPKRDHYAGRGYERPRTAAHSLILRNPADVVRTTPRIAVYRISAGWRAGDSYCRLSLKGVTARNLETNLPAPYSHHAAALDRRSVIRRDFLPATVFAGALSVVGSASAPLRHFLLKLVWPFKAARRLIAGIARIKSPQKSKRRFANSLQVLSLSAPSRGLVAFSDTHRDSEKEMSCVTSLLTGTTKCM